MRALISVLILSATLFAQTLPKFIPVSELCDAPPKGKFVVAYSSNPAPGETVSVLIGKVVKKKGELLVKLPKQKSKPSSKKKGVLFAQDSLGITHGPYIWHGPGYSIQLDTANFPPGKVTLTMLNKKGGVFQKVKLGCFTAPQSDTGGGGNAMYSITHPNIMYCDVQKLSLPDRYTVFRAESEGVPVAGLTFNFDYIGTSPVADTHDEFVSSAEHPLGEFDPSGRLGTWMVSLSGAMLNPSNAPSLEFEVVSDPTFLNLDTFFTKAEAKVKKSFIVGDDNGSGGLQGDLFVLDRYGDMLQQLPFDGEQLSYKPEASGYVMGCLDDGRITPVRPFFVLEGCSGGVNMDGYILGYLSAKSGWIETIGGEFTSADFVWLIYQDGYVENARIEADGSWTIVPTRVGSASLYLGDADVGSPLLTCGVAQSNPYPGLRVVLP